MTILHLTLKKKWFDDIDDEYKLEEYRDIKPYWVRRLTNNATPHSDMWGEDGCLDEYIAHLRSGVGFKDIDELMKFFECKFEKFDAIHFRNGYSKKSPQMLVECKGITIGQGNPNWGASGDLCFVIKLGKKL